MGFNQAAFSSADSASAGALNTQQAANSLNFFGGLSSSIGSYQMGMYQSQVAKNNAAIEEANATQAILSNTLNESNAKTRTGILIGQEKAAQGANGLDVGIGTPAQVRASTEKLSAMDIAMMHYNAANEATTFRNKALAARAQAGLDAQAAANDLVGGVMKAGGSLLSGSASLSSKWAQFKQYQAPDSIDNYL